MIVGVLKEPIFESRVSLLAETAAILVKKGVEVWVESGAGVDASCSDEEYVRFGAIIRSRKDVLESSDIILSIHQPPPSEIANLRSKVLLGVYQALFNQ